MPKSPQSTKRLELNARLPPSFKSSRTLGNFKRYNSRISSTDIAQDPLNAILSMADPLEFSPDALATATAQIFDSLEALRERYGVETVLVVTRGNIKQPRFSRVHASRKASRFLRNVVRTDAGQLAEKLEGYIVSGAADHGGIPHSTVKMKQKEQIKIARDFILNGLIDILREENMPEDQIPKSMNYKSYETKIVEQCGVVLIGYPGDKGIVNPGELDALMLKELLCRLNDGRCHWKKLHDSNSNTREVRAIPQDNSQSVQEDLSTSRPQSPLPGHVSETHPPSPSSSEGMSPSWLQELTTTTRTPESDGASPMAEDDETPITDYPSQTAPMMHYEPPPCYQTQDSVLWQTSDPVARAMQVLYRAYMEAFISLFPNHPPPLTFPSTGAALPSFLELRSTFSPASDPFYSTSADMYHLHSQTSNTSATSSPLGTQTPSDVYGSPTLSEIPNLIAEAHCFGVGSEEPPSLSSVDEFPVNGSAFNHEPVNDPSLYPWFHGWNV